MNFIVINALNWTPFIELDTTTNTLNRPFLFQNRSHKISWAFIGNNFDFPGDFVFFGGFLWLNDQGILFNWSWQCIGRRKKEAFPCLLGFFPLLQILLLSKPERHLFELINPVIFERTESSISSFNCL
jgi:hypothetical protein